MLCRRLSDGRDLDDPEHRLILLLTESIRDGLTALCLLHAPAVAE